MNAINIHEAKTHLSRLVEQVERGESVVIARSGRPVARLAPLDAPAPGQKRRLGFLSGQIAVPEDFDRMGEQTVAALFEG